MKRTFDLALALALLVPAAVVCTLAALAIRITSRGPALFRQIRLGQGERAFECLKLRTMYVDTANAPTHETPVSAVTPVGRFLRRSKLDELPQIWNILRGEMSFVGPRPNLPSQVELTMRRRARGLYNIRPGITGVAQIAGVDMSDPRKLADLDATYLADMSVRRDLSILALTFLGAGRGDRTKA